MVSQLPITMLQSRVLRLPLSCIFKYLIDHSIINLRLNAKNPDPV